VAFGIDDLHSKVAIEAFQHALLREQGVTNISVTGSKTCIEYDHNTLGPRDVLKIVQVQA